MNDEELLWMMDMLSVNQHPDPEGFVASLKTDESNMAGISEMEASEFGIYNTDEPALSVFGALQRDIKYGTGDRYKDANRIDIRGRVLNGLMSDTTPKNPFLDSNGNLNVGIKVRKSEMPDDKEMIDMIVGML